MKGLSMGKFGMVTVNDTFVIMGLHHTTEKTKTIRSSAFSTDFFSAFCRNTLRHHYLKSLHICPVWKLCFFFMHPQFITGQNLHPKGTGFCQRQRGAHGGGGNGAFLPSSFERRVVPSACHWQETLTTNQRFLPPSSANTHTACHLIRPIWSNSHHYTSLCVVTEWQWQWWGNSNMNVKNE